MIKKTVTTAFLVIALVVFLLRGKAGNDNWSDEVFFAEFVGLCLINVLLVVFMKYLPIKRTLLPWLLATLAAFVLIAYVSEAGIIKAPSLGYLITNLPSFGTFPLRFFGLFAAAPEGDSTRAALLDTQLAMAGGFVLGLLLQKYPKRISSPKRHS